jgi:hypothetical protein
MKYWPKCFPRVALDTSEDPDYRYQIKGKEIDIRCSHSFEFSPAGFTMLFFVIVYYDITARAKKSKN